MRRGRRSDAAAAAAGGQRVRPDLVAVGYLAAAAVVVWQLLVLPEPVRTLRAAMPYLVALVAYVVVLTWRRRGGTPEQALVGLAVFGAVLAVWLIVSFLAGLPAGAGDPSGFYRVKLGVTSPLGDHNTAAGLLLPPLAACCVLAARDRRWDAAAVIVQLGLIAALSRGAALVLAVVVVAGWAVVPSGSARWRMVASAGGVLAAVLALAAVLGAAPPGIDGEDGPATSADEADPAEVVAPPPDAQGPFGASLVGRADLILRGVRAGADHPVGGVGLGRFGDHARDLPPPNGHAHNLFAHAFAEGGGLLLAVAVALPVLLAVRLWRMAPGATRGALVVGSAGLVLHAQHDILGGLLAYEVLLAVLLAMAATSGPVRDAQDDRHGSIGR